MMTTMTMQPQQAQPQQALPQQALPQQALPLWMTPQWTGLSFANERNKQLLGTFHLSFVWHNECSCPHRFGH
jgi:hypothetical protein